MYHESIGTGAGEWAGKTYAEIASVGGRDGSVLVVPVGSIEQHGHHMPVSTDTILADAVVGGALERAVEEIPVLATPPVWSGLSPHHLPFGGTLSLEFRHLLSVLEDVARTGLENGFDAVLFVNGHGGNRSAISAVTSTLGTRTDAQVLGTSYFALAAEEIDEIRESETGGMSHGGEYETSLMLHLRPDLVADPEDREAPLMDEPYEWGGSDLMQGGSVSVYRTFDEYSEVGAIGAPDLASAEKGERIYRTVAEELAALLVAVHEHNADST